MAVGDVVHELANCPAAVAVRRIELAVVEAVDGLTKPLGKQANRLNGLGDRLRRMRRRLDEVADRIARIRITRIRRMGIGRAVWFC